MDEREIARSLREIEERLLRLERFTRIASASDAAPPPPAPSASGPAVPAREHPASAPEGVSAFLQEPAPRELTAPARPHDPFAPPPVPSAPSIRSATSTEQVIGGRIAAWVGAVIVMIGVGVLVKYAYDQEWLGQLGKWGRFAGATATALALVGAGEFALRRWGRAAAAGLFGAGIGSLFVIASAVTLPEVMPVFGAEGALAFSLGAVALGTLVAWRSRLLAVGVVVMVGAYAVPIFTGTLRLGGSLWPPVYLTAVLAAGLAIGHWSSAQRSVRLVAVILHVLVAGLLLAGRGLGPRAEQAFVMLWWALVTLEAVAAVVRQEGRRVDPEQGGETVAPASPTSGRAEVVLAGFAMVASIGAAFFFAGAWTGPGDLWAWLPVGQGVLAFAASALLRSMRLDAAGAPGAMERMISALEALGAAAVVSAVALLFSEQSAGAIWAVMGCGAAFLAARNGSMPLGLLATAACGAATAVASVMALRGSMSGVGVWQGTIPGFAASQLRAGPNWWLPLIVLVSAVASVHALRPLARGAWMRGVLLAWSAASMAALATAVGVNGSELLVAAALPAWLLLVPRPLGDPLVRRGGQVLAILLLVAVVVAAVFARLGGRADPTSQALALLVSAGLVALHGVRDGGKSGRVELTLAWVMVGLTALLHFDVRRSSAPADPFASEVQLVAGLGAAGALLLRAGLGRGAAMGLALWSAAAWLYGGIVMTAAFGLASVTPMSNISNATAAVVLAAIGASLPVAASAGACAVLLVVMAAGSLDLERLARTMDGTAIDRATVRQALHSVWWAAVAVAGVLAGFRWRLTALRWLSLSVLGVAALKVLVLDMRGSPTLARVAALLGVGLFMVIVSVVYARAERRLRRDASGA